MQEFYEHYKRSELILNNIYWWSIILFNLYVRIESIKLKVTNLINDDGIITSGSQDGQIKLWDIKK